VTILPYLEPHCERGYLCLMDGTLPAEEITVTPEMIEAGLDELLGLAKVEPTVSNEELVRTVYEAMEAARRAPSCKAPEIQETPRGF